MEDSSRQPDPSAQSRLDLGGLRALTHPLRLRLFEMLRTGPSATATDLAHRLDETPQLVSYHLRTLASSGLVEEDETRQGDRRRRWWRASDGGASWSSADFLDNPERRAAAVALRRTLVQAYVEELERYLDEEPAWGADWADAAVNDDYVLRLTPDELRVMADELRQVIRRYEDRSAAPRSQHVQVIFHMFPKRLK